MSWLSKATGIHLGNVGAPLGAIAGSFVGQPQLGAAIGQTVGAMGQHKSPVKAALEGAAVYGGSKLLGGGGTDTPATGAGGSMAGTGTAGTSGSGGGGLFDDPTKLGWAKLGVDVLGGAMGGAAGAKANAAEMAERQREFNAAYGLQSGQAAMNARQQLDAAPLRDRVMYQLQQILSQTPSTFKPHDIYNGGGVAQPSGYDMGKVAAANSAYTPGAGGVNTDVIKKFLATLGYPQPQPTGTFPSSRLPAPQIPTGVRL